MSLTSIALAIILGYVIGSLPMAYIVGRIKGVNIFEVGSGNMGATNVARACGVRYGILVWLLDGLKGVVAVLIARWMIPDHPVAASMLAAVAVVAGHSWSFLASLISGGIRGGKGAATASGTFILLAPTLLVALTLGVAALIVLLTRYVSLGVMSAVVVACVVIVALINLDMLDPAYVLYLFVGYMILVRHRSNIYNLLHGRERRLGERV